MPTWESNRRALRGVEDGLGHDGLAPSRHENYIHRLQRENRELEARLAAVERRHAEMLRHLQLPKFTAEGPLQNYINTSDVQRWLRYVVHGDLT